jgi:adenylosuccinate lyase
MIDRYTRPEIGAIWTDKGKYDSWLQVELAVVDAWTKRGVIPEEDRDAIRSGADYDIDRIDEIERTTHHDVIAFLTSVAEHVGPASRWVHLGMTSSDMLDTALALQMKQAGKILIDGVDPLMDALKEKALQYKDLPSIGRTHGVHAEPVSFGLRFARFYEQLARAKERLIQSYDWVCTGKLSGAVGMYVHLDPAMEQEVMEALSLNTAPISSQIVSRDRHADFLAAISLIGTILESIALEVRHLQRTEVREAREGFAKGQKGSSAMPHKRNPINAEKICGMARLLRSNMHAAFDNVALWHERDISHSSVERVILPDSTIGLDYLLNLSKRMVKNLVVDEDRVQEVLDLTRGAVFSEGLLLALVRSGLTREEGYAMVQRIAHQAVDHGASVKEAALNDQDIVQRIGSEEVERAFDVKHALRHTNAIYQRIGFVQ